MSESPVKSTHAPAVHRPSLHHDWIDPHAFGIVKALQRGGHTTYLVGGCVRDLLIGIHPKDFDIATLAHPPQVKRLIHMAFIIGKRFRLVLVKREDNQYEVATFRKNFEAEEPEPPSEATDPGIGAVDIEPTEESASGESATARVAMTVGQEVAMTTEAPSQRRAPPATDNIFGTPEEDAKRRDFTINALFYDPVSGQLIDYVRGQEDVERGLIRMIGDPRVRLVEDSIRILRALRLSHKIGFSIEAELRQAISEKAGELLKAVLPRRREEILKIMRLDQPERALLEAWDLGIIKIMIPSLEPLFVDPEARELFEWYLRQLREFDFAPDQNIDALAILIFAWALTSDDISAQRGEMPVWAIGEGREATLERCLREELGAHRFEQSILIRSLSLRHLLAKTDEFARRGDRRLLAVLGSEGFSLALRVGELSRRLSPDQVLFWKSALVRLGSQIKRTEVGGRPPGRRRRPRPKPRRQAPSLDDQSLQSSAGNSD